MTITEEELARWKALAEELLERHAPGGLGDMLAREAVPALIACVRELEVNTRAFRAHYKAERDAALARVRELEAEAANRQLQTNEFQVDRDALAQQNAALREALKNACSCDAMYGYSCGVHAVLAQPVPDALARIEAERNA